MSLKHGALACVLFTLFRTASAFTECSLNPTSTWLALDGNNVWICFDKGNCVYKDVGGYVTDKHLGRMYAMGLTAVSTGKPLLVRYSDAVSCGGLDASSKTNRVDGLWLVK